MAVLCSVFQNLTMILETAILCLALNIFHEARGEPEAGRIEVALVTVNRAQAEDKNVCEVVKQPGQFSWYTSSTKLAKPNTEPHIWKRSVKEARAVYHTLRHLDERNSLYFHSKSVKPKWRKHKKHTITIGNHVFYTNRKS